MKMILLRVRDSPRLLYEAYTVPSEEDESKQVVWTTENDSELEGKLRELIEIYPKYKLQPVSDLSWLIDIVLGD